MFTHAYLDIAFGMLLIFLLYSLLAMTILEMLASIFKLRARHLYRSLTRMLGDNHLGAQLPRNFSAHPLIRRMISSRKSEMPSYLTPETFSLVLQDVLPDFYLGEGQSLTVLEKLKLMPDGDFKRSIMTFHPGHFVTIDAVFRTWFGITMERLSGAYKRMTQHASFLIGLILAISFNVDAISLFKQLSAERVVTEERKLSAANLYIRQRDSLNAVFTCDTCLLRELAVREQWLGRAQDKAEATLLAVTDRSGLGWSTAPLIRSTTGKLTMICGWMITALVIAFGAPFWFDLLQKLIRVRTTGIKPPNQTQTDEQAVKR